MELSTISSQVLIKLLNKKPGIKDNNVQIQKLKLKCLQKVIEKFGITRYYFYKGLNIYFAFILVIFIVFTYYF